MKTVKLGIIGAGHIFWNSHWNNLSGMDGVELAAVCDPSEGSQKRAREEIGARTYADVASLVAAESEVDALLNFSPPFVRKQAIEAAIRLDVPVFVEKPVAGTVKEAGEILALLEASPVPVSVGFMWRYMPAVNRCRELLEGKQVTHVYSEFFCPAITQWGVADWFFKKEISGGPIVDQAIHLFDLIRYLVGDVEAVMSFGANVVRQPDEAFTIEDSSSTILKFASGTTGAHNHSWVHDLYGGSVTLRTEHDRLTVDLVEERLSGVVDGDALDFEVPQAEAGKNDHCRELEVFLDAVRTKDFSAVRSGYADATRSLAVAEAVNDAMASGELVNVKEA